jgi:NADH:ubiquinone oxidoreductase subunit 4 (subunit M)
LKRRAWGKKYRISEAVIFNLYSEFSSMIMISKFENQKMLEDE